MPPRRRRDIGLPFCPGSTSPLCTTCLDGINVPLVQDAALKVVWATSCLGALRAATWRPFKMYQETVARSRDTTDDLRKNGQKFVRIVIALVISLHICSVWLAFGSKIKCEFALLCLNYYIHHLKTVITPSSFIFL